MEYHLVVEEPKWEVQDQEQRKVELSEVAKKLASFAAFNPAGVVGISDILRTLDEFGLLKSLDSSDPNTVTFERDDMFSGSGRLDGSDTPTTTANIKK